MWSKLCYAFVFLQSWYTLWHMSQENKGRRAKKRQENPKKENQSPLNFFTFVLFLSPSFSAVSLSLFHTTRFSDSRARFSAVVVIRVRSPVRCKQVYYSQIPSERERIRIFFSPLSLFFQSIYRSLSFTHKSSFSAGCSTDRAFLLFGVFKILFTLFYVRFIS